MTYNVFVGTLNLGQSNPICTSLSKYVLSLTVHYIYNTCAPEYEVHSSTWFCRFLRRETTTTLRTGGRFQVWAGLWLAAVHAMTVCRLRRWKGAARHLCIPRLRPADAPLQRQCAKWPTDLFSCTAALLLLLLLLLLHDLYSANFEDRVGGAGVSRWRTWL